jgi:uncharacterized DUF497 family protein
METFSGLDWDEGNLAKCQKHGVSVEEIEAVFAGEPQYSPDTVHSIDGPDCSRSTTIRDLHHPRTRRAALRPSHQCEVHAC